MGVEWGGRNDPTVKMRLQILLAVCVTVLALVYLADTSQETVDDGLCSPKERCAQEVRSG